MKVASAVNKEKKHIIKDTRRNKNLRLFRQIDYKHSYANITKNNGRNINQINNPDYYSQNNNFNISNNNNNNSSRDNRGCIDEINFNNHHHNSSYSPEHQDFSYSRDNNSNNSYNKTEIAMLLKVLKTEIIAAFDSKIDNLNSNLNNNTNRINQVFEKLGLK